VSGAKAPAGRPMWCPPCQARQSEPVRCVGWCPHVCCGTSNTSDDEKTEWRALRAASRKAGSAMRRAAELVLEIPAPCKGATVVSCVPPRGQSSDRGKREMLCLRADGRPVRSILRLEERTPIDWRLRMWNTAGARCPGPQKQPPLGESEKGFEKRNLGL